MAKEPEAQGGPHSAKREDAVVKGREKGNKGRKKESWWLRGAGNAAVNPRLGKGPGLWEAGQVRLKWGLAQAEGTPLAGVGSCVPKAGIGLCAAGIRITLKREDRGAGSRPRLVCRDPGSVLPGPQTVNWTNPRSTLGLRFPIHKMRRFDC